MAFFGQTAKAIDGIGQEVGRHVGGAAFEARKHLDNVGHEVGRQVGEAAPKALQKLDQVGQEVGKKVSGAAARTGGWIVKHPGETASIVGCVVAAPLAIAITPLVLGAIGFTSAGVAAGSAAAAAQAGIGNVVAGSAFAILQSAGAGGAGLATVNAIVGTAAAVGAVGAATPALIKAANECDNEEEIGDVGEDKAETDSDNGPGTGIPSKL